MVIGDEGSLSLALSEFSIEGAYRESGFDMSLGGEC